MVSGAVTDPPIAAAAALVGGAAPRATRPGHQSSRFCSFNFPFSLSIPKATASSRATRIFRGDQWPPLHRRRRRCLDGSGFVTMQLCPTLPANSQDEEAHTFTPSYATNNNWARISVPSAALFLPVGRFHEVNHPTYTTGILFPEDGNCCRRRGVKMIVLPRDASKAYILLLNLGSSFGRLPYFGSAVEGPEYLWRLCSGKGDCDIVLGISRKTSRVQG